MIYVKKLPFLYERATTLQVIYYMPDYTHLLQEFIWQFDDYPPIFPRCHKFLNHWKDKIKVPIKEVNLASSDISNGRFINAKEFINF